MVHLRHWSKLVFIGLLAVLLAACKPLASFSINPQPVKVGVLTTFDASASSASTSPRGNAIVSYAWDFGDGKTAQGKTATHSFANAGTFTVKLTVIDKAGRVGTSVERVKVQAAEPAGQRTLKVSVQSADGVDLAGATVSIGTQNVQTDTDGQATLMVTGGGSDSVLSVRRAGYVTQALRLPAAAGDDSNETTVRARLTPVKDTIAIDDIATPAVYGSSVLAASVALPANALVIEGTSTPAIGQATLQLTPWDITSDDLLAMPGNGRARTASGSLVDLISAGMITVNFVDANGNKLQLATGKTATIQMDLPFNSINGTELQIGSEIPMWNFSETEGLWIEEGIGTVVQGSAASPTGLAVSAVVSHFSTWNWDIEFENPGSLTVSCVDDEGQLVACSVTADLRLIDGSRFTKSISLPAAITEVINMPIGGTIEWTGITAGGLIGRTTSGTSGNVVIQIGEPTTNNRVRCLLPTGTGVACHVTLNLNDVTSGPVSKRFFIPAEGASVKTAWSPVGSLQWDAQSVPTTNAANQLATYTGTATSGITGSVSITLGNETILPSQRLRLQCDTEVDFFDVDTGLTTRPLESCNLSVSVSPMGDEFPSFDFEAAYRFNNVPTGSVVSVLLPALAEGSNLIQVYAEGVVQTGNGSRPAAFWDSIELSTITDNALRVIRLGSNLVPPIEVVR